MTHYDHLLSTGAERLASFLKEAADPKMSGNLKQTADAAWHMGSYTKPKTTPMSRPGQKARSMPTPKPPSLHSYHKDVVQQMNDPSHGVRVSLPRT